ncbi:MAG: SURF1 family protein, partial [Betaproteobacteria bacterium]|nr:SURF1 family protein [Betaproteobacteria bacterium]
PGAVIRQNIELAQFAKYHNIKMLPYVIQEMGREKDGLVRSWPQPDVGMDTNYGYAFQWYSMTALGLGLTIYFLGKRVRDRSRTLSHKELHS